MTGWTTCMSRTSQPFFLKPKKNIFLVMSVFGLLLFARPGLAIDFSFNPMIIEGAVAPGTSETAEFELYSKNTATYTIRIDQALPKKTKKDEKNPYPVSEWLHISQTEIAVEADTTTKIPFSVLARPDAKGEVAAYLTVKPSSKNLEGLPMGISPAVGPTIYVYFTGTQDPRGELKNFGWTYHSEDKKIQFEWKVTSTGNVHLRPREEISICSKESKEEIKKIYVTPRAPAFPGETVVLFEPLPASEIPDLAKEYWVEIKVYYGEVYDKPDLIFTAAKTGRLDKDVK